MQSPVEESRDGGGALDPKHAIAATFLKIDRFSERMGAIRRQIADRRERALRLRDGVDHVRNNPVDADSGPRDASLATRRHDANGWDGDQDRRYDPIKLPRLLDGTQPMRATEPTFDGRLLSMDAMRSRASEKNHYEAAWDLLQRAEQQAAAAVQEADRLTEEARIAMVLYAQNERTWSFDERARRYQLVMQAKKEAEGARLKADDDRILVQCLRAQLKDPYQTFLETRGQANTTTLVPIGSPARESVYVWILASPLLTLPFTPRDSSHGTVLAAEKELSTHVVYYAAPSLMDVNEAGNADDKPPTDGWVCCSSHGATPTPIVTPVRSAIETWLVSGAGATHLNGKYLFTGIHNGTRKFKSTSGVELFRKELPKTSSIIRGVVDAAVESQDEDLSSLQPPDIRVVSQSSQLPGTLRALEKNDRDFKSMEKIGAWMNSDTLQQKRRRMRDEGFARQVANQDGDHVLTQETDLKRLDPKNVVRSRHQANADLCREWVLFMCCSRRADKPLSDAPKRNLGLGCLKRHYYISIEEKERMTIWAQEQEAWLEKDVLATIIRREAYIQRVSRSCQKCMSKFQQDMREETEIALCRVFRELNTVRFLTVKVLEAIEIWRAHARKRGFTTYEDGADAKSSNSSTLGWSASITVNTGKKLFKGSHAFASKFKRYCRPEDPHGQDERRLVYLGYYATRDEAEQAYDEFANAEARRLNTTASHLPRRRNVFRSCGKHFSVESERLGPDYCIECASKQISIGGSVTSGPINTDDWNPPFFYPSGKNYILKVGNDLDFLDDVLPLKLRLNQQPTSGLSDDKIDAFPLLGNVFLLPRTPIQDPSLVYFTTLAGSGTVPRLHGGENNQYDEDDEILDEALDADRILKAQRIFLQEVQIYHPELFHSSSSTDESNQTEEKGQITPQTIDGKSNNARRTVQALYWDRCAALRIKQERTPLPFRQDNIWCRPDAGEWASFLVRGKHQQHVLFENRLVKAGKETQERRKKALKILRKLLKTPIYFVPSRDVIRSVIAEGEHVKGDVVLLEVKSAYKFLDKYDLWCLKTLVVQRWYRGVRGRKKTRATRRALHLASAARKRYMEAVSKVSTHFYVKEVLPVAMRSTMKKLRLPVYSRAVKIDGELLIVSIHAAESISSASGSTDIFAPKLSICRSCARRFHVRTYFDTQSNTFQVGSPVCCCTLNSPANNTLESWVVRAYNPLNNIIYRIVVQNDLISQLVTRSSSPESGSVTNSPCPLLLCQSSSRAVERATSLCNFTDRLVTRAFDHWNCWRIISDEATQRRKLAEIDLERARERVVELAKRFQVAIVDARRALDFTSRSFEEAQAWDPLENANDWRLLVQKRHTQKELSSAIDEADKRRFELFQAKADENNARTQSELDRRTYEARWKPLLKYHESVVDQCTIERERNVANATAALGRICTSQLALRDTFLAPTRRALVIAPPAWKRTDMSMVRMLMIASPGLERGRNTLRRRAMQLSDEGKMGELRCVRLIVDVSAWTTAVTSGAGENRNVWVSAYNPATTHVQRIYLEWEMVQLLATVPVVRQPRASERERWVKIADKLLSLCMLDRFTGEFTLRKLQFYHHLRLLRPHFFASRWFQDLTCGRKCGDGDEIYRQSTTISGRLCFVVVYENWGDLVVRVYRSSSPIVSTLRISLDQVFSLLAQKPLALHLWVLSVKSNQYAANMISTVLRFVRIRDDDELVLVTSPSGDDIVSQATKPIYISTTIQQRRVLLRFKDSVCGDLAVYAYDMAVNRSFQLLLEWENIRRVLRSCEVPQTSSSSAMRRRNLTLTRNRRELCEWITSRLRFQSFMEHPDVLASSFSPLVSGVQVRTTFLIFNEWISTSVRNPLPEMSQRDIDKYAAAADAALFRGLAHEQLAFVPQARLPCSYDKEFLQTRDFIAKGLAASELGASARHLKIDFFSKSHQLFARVRHEVMQEVIARHEREEQQLMEKEEVLALRLEIEAACDTAWSELTKCCGALGTVKQCIVDRLIKTEPLFEQLHKSVADRIVASGKKRPVVRKPKNTGEAKQYDDFEPGAVASLLLHFVRQHGDASHEILVIQRFNLRGTLRTLLHQLGEVEVYVANTLTPKLEALHAKARNVVQQESHLNILQDSRSDVLNSYRAFIATFEGEPSGTEEIAEDLPVAKTEQVDGGLACRTIETPLSDPVSGFVLYPGGSVEEVMIDSKLVLSRPFSDVSVTLSNELVSTFSRPIGSRKLQPNIQLHVKRVSSGMIVSDGLKTTGVAISWNPRATALAMEPVAGIAVFIPANKAPPGWAFPDIDSLFRSLTWFEPNDLLRKPRPSSGSIGAARRRTVQRSKQLLPWKQLSVERIQTSRKLRQQRARLGLLLARVDEDDERELATLAVYSTSGHHVEWMTGGRVHPVDAYALSTIVESLRLHKHIRWSLGCEGENRMQQLFDELQRIQSVPSELPTSELNLGHFRVEADNWRSPRRLIFSCHELQSHRQYFVDCSYSQLESLLRVTPGNALRWPVDRLPVQEWRTLALAAAKHLIFRRKNGSLGLDFAWPHSGGQHLLGLQPSTQLAENPLDSATLGANMAALPSDGHAPSITSEAIRKLAGAPTGSVNRAGELELQLTIRLCRSRRFLKHQNAIRHVITARQREQTHATLVTRQLPLEWLRMTQEDWNSQEYRGLLILDAKEVKKVKTAFSRVHQRLAGSITTPNNSVADLGQWLMEMDKEMGVKEHDKANTADMVARYEREAEQYLSRMACSRWWNEKHAQDARLILDAADVAEWWRRMRHVPKPAKNKAG